MFDFPKWYWSELPTYLPTQSLTYLSIYLPVCLPVYLPIHLSVHQSITYLSVCQSLLFFLPPSSLETHLAQTLCGFKVHGELV